jgi:DHA1 family tetracycline resistance protein-like MFS transporter
MSDLKGLSKPNKLAKIFAESRRGSALLLPSKGRLQITRRSPLIPIFLIVAVDVLGLTIILPLLPFYAEKMGASATQVGLLVSVYSLCQLFSGPLLGRLSDRTGRKPLLLLSQAGTFIGFLVLAYAGSLWIVFLARIIDGLTAGNISLAQAYISDVTEPEKRTGSFALIGIAFGLGFLIGPAISGFLAQYSYQYPIFAAAALSATSILATATLLPGTKPEAGGDGRKLSVLDWGNYAQFFRRPELGPLLWQFAVFMMAFSLFISGFALFAERRFSFGPKQVGYVYGYIGLLGVILQGGLIGRLSGKFGDSKLVQWGFLLATIGYAALAFTFRIPALLVVSAISSIGSGALRPALTSLITQRSKRTEQGTVLGLTQSLNSVSSILAPALGGMLINMHLLSTWACVTAGFCAAGLLLQRSANLAESQPSVQRHPVRP